jgi:hypothetical protein
MTRFSLLTPAFAVVSFLLFPPRVQAQKAEQPMNLIKVQKIWDRAPHNAFTDLIRFEDKWFCTFREAKKHFGRGASGDIRVISSPDGQSWESAALVSGKGDLRDPKICRTPDGRLMLQYFRRFNPTRYPKQHELNFVRFSSDGHHWGAPLKVGFPDRWMWRITWHDGKAYGVSHGGPEDRKPFSKPRSGRFLVSEDGKQFEPLADAGYGGESTIRFTENGTAYCLRRADNNRGLLGISQPPYTGWTWKDLETRIGGTGPHHIAR